MIKLIFGDTVRVRNSEGVTVLPCGCAHDDHKWLQMCQGAPTPDHPLCEDHWGDTLTRHNRAHADYAAQGLV